MRRFFAYVASGSLVFGVLPACGGDAFEEATDAAGGSAGASAGSAGASAGSAGTAGGATGGSAGATGGSAGATGGSAGATGGSAGATGGSAGATGGSAGATGGSAGATGGSAGATGGSGGSAAGAAGSAGAAGGGCAFDACNATPSNKPPPSGCSTCTQAVCKQHPSCCSSGWDEACAMFAQLNQECGCPGLVCTGSSVNVSLGKCWQGGGLCNPVTGGGCTPSQPPNQCALSTDSGQPQAFCTQVGDRPACTECNPSAGKNCQQGFSCVAGACVRLCCLDVDCGPAAKCAPGLVPGDGELGICRK